MIFCVGVVLSFTVSSFFSSIHDHGAFAFTHVHHDHHEHHVGMAWAQLHAPHIDGIYYDGINFDRLSMRRLRRALERSAIATKSLPPLLDVHAGAGAGRAPPALAYLSHYAYCDSVWNAEGLDLWNGSPLYWLVEVSGRLHGISGELLHSDSGSSSSSIVYKGMLFGMTIRNSVIAQSLWRLWNDFGIESSHMIGWWEQDLPVTAEYPRCVEPSPVPTPPTPPIPPTPPPIPGKGSKYTLMIKWVGYHWGERTARTIHDARCHPMKINELNK